MKKLTQSYVLIHAKHASENGETTIIIKSPDTDVAILQGYISTGPYHEEREDEEHLSGDFYHS